ncbi:SPFH domain-containing protein, partial [Kibdelosporangium lantanae]
LGGVTIVAPGEARVLLLFGRYTGSVRTSGMRWVNPFTTRLRVSTRIRNHETSVLKVNDHDGNPIEIAAVVVWQVQDTARALFEVNDFIQFVSIQTETAIRHIANTYPYDNHGGESFSLRDNADEITEKLSAEIGARVESAACCVIGGGGLVAQSAGTGLELQVIAAVVIGGTSILGGRGSVVGTVFGALLVGTVTSAVTLLGWRSELTALFIGVFILLAVGVDLVRERRRRRL